MGADERVSISMISICPSTGDVVYDEFDGQSLGSGACATYLLREFQTQACVLNSKWVECCRLITWEFNWRIVRSTDKNDAYQTCRTSLAWKGVEQDNRENINPLHQVRTVTLLLSYPRKIWPTYSETQPALHIYERKSIARRCHIATLSRSYRLSIRIRPSLPSLLRITDQVNLILENQKVFSHCQLNTGELMAAIADFPKRVVIVLAAAIKHLSAYGIADAFLETKFFSKFTTRTHMLLNANTLKNLYVSSVLWTFVWRSAFTRREIYRNETDFTSKGSLMWILDKTTTKFGARLLRSWVGRPLIDKRHPIFLCCSDQAYLSLLCQCPQGSSRRCRRNHNKFIREIAQPEDSA